MVGQPVRQSDVLDRIAERIAVMPEIRGALVVGSLATGTADAASDIDLIVCPAPGQFAAAWTRRADLHVTGALVSWDEGPDGARQAAAHRWVTDDLVYVEALFADPASGVRLAPGWRTIAGDPQVAASYPRRPPIDRATEFRSRDQSHPVDLAFDDLKRALRALADSGR